MQMNDDWMALRAIYGVDVPDGDDGCGGGGDRTVRLEESMCRVAVVVVGAAAGSAASGWEGRCCLRGTVRMALPTSRVAYARRVDGSRNGGGGGWYRYFVLDRPPVLRVEFLYRCSGGKGDRCIDDAINDDNDETVVVTVTDHEDHGDRADDGHADGDGHDDVEDTADDDTTRPPSWVKVHWEHYPSEWPDADKEPYRICLEKKARAVLRREDATAFAVCEFLENGALTSYNAGRSSCSGCISDGGIDGDGDDGNTIEGWKTFVWGEDDDGATSTVSASGSSSSCYADHLLVILPPEMDMMYQPNVGTLLHPKEEAAAAAAAELLAGGSAVAAPPPPPPAASTTMQFARLALVRFWRHLYRCQEGCPICLEGGGALYSDGVVLPACQHFVCTDCFVTYLRYKVQDLKQHRTNPFCCPFETCLKELPMAFCKRYLTADDIEAVRAWHLDLKHPPVWSLDRCLATRACGALGTMRRRHNNCATISTRDGKKKRGSSSSAALPASMQHLIFCQECDRTWCELCLKRVDGDDVERDYDTAHYRRDDVCQPHIPLRLCRRYAAASPDLQGRCRDRFPWIVSYSLFCQHDGTAVDYIQRHGQRCPSCLTGVERIEGCFHVKCPTCATHFCYECGAELFAPYYGTHHCWEEQQQPRDDDNDEAQLLLWGLDADEQLAVALHMAGEGYDVLRGW